jgi:hypothetical protein
MDRKFYRKMVKSHHNIITLINGAYEKQDLPLLGENIKRLNTLTAFLIKQCDIRMMELEMLKAENEALTEENVKLMDESFKSISATKGRYSEAKKMLDEFYAGL